jgi:hypothetical protein
MSAIYLCSLFKSQSKLTPICIPKIQRDYAEGRETDSVKKKRVNMLTDMIDVIFEKRDVLSLDFVYGIKDNGTFKPLDGQQRLTTLFLLHWMLGRNADLKDAQNHSLFVYETRKTSEEFCHWLVNQDAHTILGEWNKLVEATKGANRKNMVRWNTEENANGKVDKIANRLAYPLVHVPSLFEHFVEMDEFKWDWHNDPNIHSMIVVIETACQIIKDKGFDLDNADSSKLDNITFELLDSLICDGDELFEKMNARGKELSTYDILKSSLEEELEIQHSSIINDWRKQIDNDWIDYCWDSSNLPDNLTLDDVKKVEQKLEHLLTRMIGKSFFKSDIQYTSPIGGEDSPGQMLESCIFKDSDNVADNYFRYARFERGKKSASTSSFSQINLEEIFNDINNLIYKDNSNWKDIAYYLHNQGLKIHALSDKTLLDDFLDDTLLHETRVLFYAMMGYLKKVNAQTLIANTIEFSNFKDWIRFARNVFLAANKNVRIDNPSRVKDAIKAIDSWLEEYFTNFHHGVKGNEMLIFIASFIVKNGFGQEQERLDEEAIKASLRLGLTKAFGSAQDWEKAIFAAEDNPYLWGQIIAPLSWAKVKGCYYLTLFNQYVAKLNNLFSATSITDTRTAILLIQACLSVKDYRFNGDNVWGSLGTLNDDRDISWKRHLRNKNQQGVYGELIKLLMDIWLQPVNYSLPFDVFLTKYISNASRIPKTDFRYLFCHLTDEELGSIFKVVYTNKRYIHLDQSGHLYLYRSSQRRTDAVRYELLTSYLYANKNISNGLSIPNRIDHFKGAEGAFVELKKADGSCIRVKSLPEGGYEISFNGKPSLPFKNVADVEKCLVMHNVTRSF